MTIGNIISSQSLAVLAVARANAIALNPKCVRHPKQLNQK